jgi:hypothetical protein
VDIHIFEGNEMMACIEEFSDEDKRRFGINDEILILVPEDVTESMKRLIVLFNHLFPDFYLLFHEMRKRSGSSSTKHSSPRPMF